MSELEETASGKMSMFVTACTSGSKSSVSRSSSKSSGNPHKSGSSFSSSCKQSNSKTSVHSESKSNASKTESRPRKSGKGKGSKRRRPKASRTAGACKPESRPRMSGKGKKAPKARSKSKVSKRRSSKVQSKTKKSITRREAKLHNLTVALDPSIPHRAVRLTKGFKVVARRGRLQAWVNVLGGTIIARDRGILLMMGLKSIQQAIKATEAIDRCIGSRNTQACIANCMYIMQVSRVNIGVLCKKSGFSYVRGCARKRSCGVVVRVYECGKIIAIGRKLETTKKAVENVAAEI